MSQIIQELRTKLIETNRYDTPTVMVAISLASNVPSSYATDELSFSSNQVWSEEETGWTLLTITDRALFTSFVIEQRAPVVLDIEQLVAPNSSLPGVVENIQGSKVWAGNKLIDWPDLFFLFVPLIDELTLDSQQLVATGTNLPGVVESISNSKIWVGNNLLDWPDLFFCLEYITTPDGVIHNIAQVFATSQSANVNSTSDPSVPTGTAWLNQELLPIYILLFYDASSAGSPELNYYSVVSTLPSAVISTVAAIDGQELPWWSGQELATIETIRTLMRTILPVWGYGADLLRSPFSPKPELLPGEFQVSQVRSSALSRYSDFRDVIVTSDWGFTWIFFNQNVPLRQLYDLTYLDSHGYFDLSENTNLYAQPSPNIQLVVSTSFSVHATPLQDASTIWPDASLSFCANTHILAFRWEATRNSTIFDILFHSPVASQYSRSAEINSTWGSLWLLGSLRLPGPSTEQIESSEVYKLYELPEARVSDIVSTSASQHWNVTQLAANPRVLWTVNILSLGVRSLMELFDYIDANIESILSKTQFVVSNKVSDNILASWCLSTTHDSIVRTAVSEDHELEKGWAWQRLSPLSLLKLWDRLFWEHHVGKLDLAVGFNTSKTHVFEDCYIVGKSFESRPVKFATLYGSKLEINLPEWAPFKGRFYVILQLEDELGYGDTYGTSASLTAIGGRKLWPENSKLIMPNNECIFRNEDMVIDLAEMIEIELPLDKPFVYYEAEQKMDKVLIYRGYPTHVNNAQGNIRFAANNYAKYDHVVFSSLVLEPWHDEYQSIAPLCAKIKELNPATNIWFEFSADTALADQDSFLSRLAFAATVLSASGIIFNSVPSGQELALATLFRAIHSYNMRVGVTCWNPETEIFNTPLASEWWGGWDIVVYTGTPLQADGTFPTAWDVFERPALINSTLKDYKSLYWQVTTWATHNSSTMTQEELYEHAYYYALFMAYFQGASGFAFQPEDNYEQSNTLLLALPDPIKATNYKTDERFNVTALPDGTTLFVLNSKLGKLQMHVDVDGRTPLEVQFGNYATYHKLTRYEPIESFKYLNNERYVKLPGGIIPLEAFDTNEMPKTNALLDYQFVLIPGLIYAINLALIGKPVTISWDDVAVYVHNGSKFEVLPNYNGSMQAQNNSWVAFKVRPGQAKGLVSIYF